MGQIPQIFIDDLLSRLDIAEVIGERLRLRRAGANLVACCPFHTEKTPSFSVNPTKQFYHCFGCGASGDVIRFVMEHEGLHFVEAVESLAQRLGLELPHQSSLTQSSSKQALLYTLLNEAKHFYEHQLRKHALAPKVHAYLKGRGLEGKTAKQFGVGFASPAWDALYTALGTSAERIQALLDAGLIIERSSGTGGFYDRFRDRIVFPIHDKRGRVLGFGARTLEAGIEPKYLNSPETPVFSKGKSLYGVYEARVMHSALSSMLVVEGYMDVLSLVQAGIHPVVASLGTALTDKQIDSLFQLSAELVFCFDGDSAGQAAAKRALPLILSHMKEGRRARFMVLSDSEDPDAFVRTQGAQAFLDKLDQALSLSDFLFESLSKHVDLHRLENRAQLVTEAKPLIQKVPTGILQHMLYRRLAELAQIDPNTFVSQGVRSAQTFRKDFPKPKTRPSSGFLPSPALRALAMLLQDPSLTALAGDTAAFLAIDMPGAALLCATIEALRSDPQLSVEGLARLLPDELRSQFSDNRWKSLADLIPEQGVEAEFLGALARMKERSEEQVMEGVLVKAKQGILSLEEKQYLNHLLIHRDKSRVD